MLKLTLHPVELPLRHAWTIAHGTRTVQRNLIVALHDPETGHTGYGEAPAIPYYGVTIDGMLERIRAFLDARPEALAYLHQFTTAQRHEASQIILLLGRDPVGCFSACAFDQAFHDLVGKKAGMPCWEMMRLDMDAALCPPSNYTIGIAEPEQMAAKLREFPGFPVYKIKLGIGDPRGDLAILRRLREETQAPFRVDANTAWSVEQTIELSGPLSELGVEFIEQPLRRDLPRSDHEEVFRESALPIMADESCITDIDVERCAGVFHGVNIKVAKCGGMFKAQEMCKLARDLGMKVMIGCMTETTVGISAVGQLLPLLDYVDMDGALLLADGADPAEGVRLGHDGVAVFPEGEAAHGNGVRLNRELPSV